MLLQHHSIGSLIGVLCLSATVHAAPAWDALAERLGWQGGADNRCEGQFVDALQTMHFNQQAGQRTGPMPQAGEAKSHGGILLSLPDLRVDAKDASLYWQTDSGLLQDVSWRWRSGHWGWADRLRYRSDQPSDVYKAGFSVCQPDKPTWWWTAHHIVLDGDAGVSRLWHALFHIHGLPVFYMPFMQIPIDQRSHTGFFLPRWGGGNYTGSWWSLPFHMAWSDALDAHLTPIYAKESGWQLRGRMRWYTQWVQTVFKGLWAHDDAWPGMQSTVEQKYGGDRAYDALVRRVQGQDKNRHGWQILQQGHWPGWMMWRINWNRISDDWLYLQFPGQLHFWDKRRMPQSLHAMGRFFGGQLAATWLRMHTLRWFDQPNYPAVYARWPSIEWDRNWHLGAWGWLDLHLNWTRFIGQDALSLAYRQAHRWVVHPMWSQPLHAFNGWGQLRFGLHGVSTWADASHGSQAIPYMQAWHHWQSRPKTWLASVGYLYIPYRAQSHMPRLDTGMPTWVGDTFYQLNRFSGDDVLADAHEVRLRLERKWLQQAMKGGWSVALEQDIALQKHHRFAVPGDQTDPLIAHRWAPVLMEVRYRSPRDWSWVTRVGYDGTQHRLATLQSRYQFTQERYRLGAFLTRLLELPDDAVGEGIYQSVVGVSGHYDWSDHWSWSWASYGQFRPSLHWSHQGSLHYRRCCWGIKLGFVQQSGDGTGVQNSNHVRSFSLSLSTEGL